MGTVLKRNSFIPKMHKNLMQVIVFTLAFISTFSALEVMGAPRETREAEGVEGGMTNALKYLEEWDKISAQLLSDYLRSKITTVRWAAQDLENVLVEQCMLKAPLIT